MCKKSLFLGFIVASLFFSSVLYAAPPSIFQGTETLENKDMASLALEVGYEYNEMEAAQGETAEQSDELPLRLRAQISPLLELRAGAIPKFDRSRDTQSTFVEGAVLLNALPPTPITPGFGLLMRTLAPLGDDSEVYAADIDIRGIMTMSLIDLLTIDLNLGYWFGVGGTSFCETSVNGTFCDSPSQHFLPVMTAAHISLFDLLSLYVESENYFNLDKGLDDVYSKANLGGEIGLGESVSLQIGMGFGVSDTAEAITIQTGLTWHFFKF